MALFLTRTLTVLGVALPTGANQGFNDIGGLDQETQTAINQLSQLGIAQGTSASTFDPNGTVNRWQMALFLIRLLSKTGFALPSPIDQNFTDVGFLNAETQNAINQLRQVGIALGTSPTTYSPDSDVVRWQMALFLHRVLNSNQAAPLQVIVTAPSTFASSAEIMPLTITVRNPDGTPAPNRRVDVFVWSTFPSATSCNLDSDATPDLLDAGTGTDCIIDLNDPLTNSAGIVTVALTHNEVQETSHIIAWVGAVGERFQNAISQGRLDVTWGPAPHSLVRVASPFLGKFGRENSHVLQFLRSDSSFLPLANEPVVMTVTRGSTIVLTRTVYSGVSGGVVLTYAGPPDPSPGDDPVIMDSVFAFWDKDTDGFYDGAADSAARTSCTGMTTSLSPPARR